MNKVKVIFVDTNNMSVESILASSFLSSDDISSLDKYKVEEVKKEKACSLIFKNKYVGEYHINKFGKPISEDIYFNVSHSKGVVVFTKDIVSIGIDIELIRPTNEDLVNYISSKEEKEYIKNDINFYEVWTNKESLMKNIGTGIREKIKEIPALPLNGKKTYKDVSYYSRTIQYQNHIISITRETDEPFEIEIQEERI